MTSSLRHFLNSIGYKADRGLLETADLMYEPPVKIKGESTEVSYWGDINATTQALTPPKAFNYETFLSELQMRQYRR